MMAVSAEDREAVSWSEFVSVMAGISLCESLQIRHRDLETILCGKSVAGYGSVLVAFDWPISELFAASVPSAPANRRSGTPRSSKKSRRSDTRNCCESEKNVPHHVI
jgi:hypothetical protein